MPSIPELTEPLRAPKLELRLADERDIPEVLIAHQDDPLLYSALGMRRPPSGAELGRELERAPAARAAGNEVTFTIVEPERDHCRGQVRAHCFDWDHARAELELWVVPQARRRGLARGALKLTARWLFASCGIARVQLLVPPGDSAIMRAAIATGFHSEGTLRSRELACTGPADRTMLSLVPADLQLSL